MTERTYTLPEARRLLAMEACHAAGGHRPDEVIHNGTGTAVAAFCDCGHVRWSPSTAGVALHDLAQQLAGIDLEALRRDWQLANAFAVDGEGVAQRIAAQRHAGTRVAEFVGALLDQLDEALAASQ